jgi:hypothetical protein
MSEKFAMAAVAAGTRQLPLAVGATGTERRLLEQWLENGGLEGQTDIRLTQPGSTVELGICRLS